MSIEPSIANLEGVAALPRKNGELVFAAPWECRAFGLAVLLSEKGEYALDEFRARLLERIAAHEDSYYASWLTALELVLLTKGIVTENEVAKRAAEYVALERDPAF